MSLPLLHRRTRTLLWYRNTTSTAVGISDDLEDGRSTDFGLLPVPSGVVDEAAVPRAADVGYGGTYFDDVAAYQSMLNSVTGAASGVTDRGFYEVDSSGR